MPGCLTLKVNLIPTATQKRAAETWPAEREPRRRWEIRVEHFSRARARGKFIPNFSECPHFVLCVCCGKGGVVDYFIIVCVRVLIRKLRALVLCCYLQIRSLSIMTPPLNNFSQRRRRVQIKKFSDSFPIPISGLYCLRERWVAAANVCPFFRVRIARR